MGFRNLFSQNLQILKRVHVERAIIFLFIILNAVVFVLHF